MLFNSFEFIIFYITTLLFYFLLPDRYRCILLLIASYFFYMSWNPAYLILIIISTVVDYCLSIQMSKIKKRSKRKKYLYISLITNLGLLFYFKYFNFFSSQIEYIFNLLNIHYKISNANPLLPVGISFYTFQTLSYSIEVYRGEQKAEKNLGIFALYVSFFPQLVAGPIERSRHLLPQFSHNKIFKYDRVVSGLHLIIWGFFKKLVVADRLAIYVNTIYDNHTHHEGMTLLVATFFFTFQIYCDFSGYSDIAIGSARVIGYDLRKNFNRPYFSTSIQEFWRRWHISLSTWFKDYLYIPLGGNKVVKWRLYYNLLLVFVISGLWHGANWTFILWGALHGFYLILYLLSKRMRQRLAVILFGVHPIIYRCLAIAVTFALVSISWVFFRADSIVDAFMILKKMVLLSGELYIGQPSNFIYSFLAIFILLAIEIKGEFSEKRLGLIDKPSELAQDIFYVILIIMILMIGVFDGGQFIYFQF